MDLDPGESPRRFGVHKDPIFHVYIANAITLAYSCIEELGLQVKATKENPSKMPDGNWNASVKSDVEARLKKSGINITDPHVWTLRGPKTRIEARRAPTSAGKTSWTRGQVRDVKMMLIDALAHASWLRSTTTTHGLSSSARSLTVYDAYNVQSLARRLFLEKLGFWRTEIVARRDADRDKKNRIEAAK
jgi:hypothetical protein